MTDLSAVERLRRQAEHERERYLRIVETSPDAIFTVEGGRVTYANAASLALFGAGEPADLLGRDPLEFFAMEAREGIRERYRRIVEHLGEVVASRETLTRLDGATVPIELRAFAYESDAGLVVQSSYRDLSELADEREYSSAIIDSLPGIFYHYDETGRLIRWNKDHERITGHSPQALWRSTLFEHFPPQQHRMIAETIERVLRDGEGSTAADFLFADGESRPFLLYGRRFVSRQGGTGMIGIGLDLSEKHAAEQRIRRLAYYDATTGLRNRHYFEEHVAGLLAGSDEPFLLLSIGIDGFTDFNDNYGLRFGDSVLCRIAEAIQGELAGYGDRATLMRHRGDEFMLLLEGEGDLAVAEAVASSLRERFSRPLAVAERELHVSVSIGAAGYPDHAQVFDELLRCVDIAMHEVKRRGGSGFRVFRPEMAERLRRHMQLESELRLALRGGGGLRLVYQPIAMLRTGRIDSVEALLRWRHPEFGVVSPDVFVPIAEESELAVELGGWVLRAAVRQLREWQDAGLPEFPVAINVSAAQFEHGDFVSEATRALGESGIAPERLKIELTETTIARNLARVRDQLQRLRANGVESAIDDYGTGYSNLSYLQDLPTDYLKIDRSFVAELCGDGNSDLIVRNVIDVAHGLHREVIAEGVETAEQLALLRGYGCDYVQGWAIGRPAEAADITALIRRDPLLAPPVG